MVTVITWLWGNKYGVKDVNRLARGVRKHSKTIDRFVLFTDQVERLADLDLNIEQNRIPDLYLCGRGCFCRLRMEEKKENFGASDLRLIFWAGLYQKHRLSEEEVGDMIDAMGAQKVSEIFWQAVNSAASKMPKGNGVDADPPQPTLGPIGTNSSSVG